MAIPEDILSNESLRKRLEEFLGKQNGIYVDENTHRHLEELCRQMASVYGIVESVLQVALTKEGEERTAYIKTALDISARATRSIKQFLGEWSILVGEANRPRGTPKFIWARLLFGRLFNQESLTKILSVTRKMSRSSSF